MPIATLWEKIFQKKKTLPQYKFQQSPWDDSTWVEITSGEYAGVVFSYGTVRFSLELDIPKLNFSYNIIQPGNFSKELLQNDQDFVIIMGDILTEIIIYEQIRKDDTEESDLQ